MTRQLLTRFHENLWKRHLPPLEALRQAQLGVFREGSWDSDHPAYWAAWVLSGDPGGLTHPVSQTSPSDASYRKTSAGWPLAVLGVLLALGLLVVLAARTRHKSRVSSSIPWRGAPS